MGEDSGARSRTAVARLAAVCWTALLVFALLTPVLPVVPGLPFLPWQRGPEQPSWLDKVIHLLLFLVETRLLGLRGVLRRDRAAPRRAVACALVLAAVTEALQAPIPLRVADWGDFVANLVGIALAVLIGRPRSVGGGGQTR